MTDKLEAALDYAARGWPVFPVRPGQKVPATAHGFKDATTDPDQISEWWRLWPTANLGLPTGVAFDVLDIDIKNVDGILTFIKLMGQGSWPKGPTVETPTRGRHLYVLPTGIGNRASFAPGLDWRGSGGYVVAPPSQTARGVYRWTNDTTSLPKCPPWLLAALRTPALPAKAPRRPLVVLPGGRYASAALRGEVDRIRAASVGERNDTLNRAAFAMGTLVGSGVLDAGIAGRALLDAALEVGLSETESRKTILSGLNKGADQRRQGVSA